MTTKGLLDVIEERLKRMEAQVIRARVEPY